jgi:predicted nucleic acid-binding protein
VAADHAERYAVALAPLLVPDRDDLAAGLDLFREAQRLGAFDCVLAAASRRREARCLVSADQGFADVRGLRVVDPSDRAAVTLMLSG